LNFNLGGVKRQFIIDQAVAYNVNARPNSPVDQPDSDGDGLSDSEELNLVLDNVPCPGTLPPCCSAAAVGAGTCPAGQPACCNNVPSPTDPTMMDTDGDGFSDGLEVYMHRLNATFQFDPSPRQSGSNIDPGCAADQIGVDADADHVLDCDELLLGMSAETWDSDGDGLPDGAEWLANPIGSKNPVMVSQPTSPDADADPDRDKLSNAVELRGHTDPGAADVANLTSTAARYQVVLEPTPSTGGQQCYSLAIDNVLLVPTLDTGEGPGWNHIFLSVSEVSQDDPGMQPIYRVVELKARYPVGGIKTPADGVLSVKPTDFVLKK
jgi:hypothetical protein